MLRHIVFLLLLATGFVVYPAGDRPHPQEKSFKAQIIVTNNGENYKFVGSLLNHTANEVNCSYELQVSRQGRPGTSSSSQEGAVTAKPGKETVLSTSSVNIGENDCCKVTLLIRASNLTIATDTLNINCFE